MDPQQSSSNRAGSTFVKCVGCEKLVRLPADPDPDAIVKCPRCDETYPIGVLLDAEIPELEIVTSESNNEDDSEKPEINIETDEQNRFIVAPALSKGAKRPKRRRSSGSRSNGQAESNWDASEEPRPTSSSERSHRKQRQPKKKPPSGRYEILKIALGALMAPPVAQLVIWWGLQLDPLKFGPAVAKAIPVVVPEIFHGDPDEDDDSQSDTDAEKTEEASADERPDLPSNDQTKKSTGWSD